MLHEGSAARDVHWIAPAEKRVVDLAARVLVLAVTDRADRRTHDYASADLLTEPAVEDVRRDVPAAAVMGDLHHVRTQKPALSRVVRGLLEAFRADIGGQHEPAALQLGVLHHAGLVGSRSRVGIVRERLDVPGLV